jgi:hypothetical protein
LRLTHAVSAEVADSAALLAFLKTRMRQLMTSSWLSAVRTSLLVPTPYSGFFPAGPCVQAIGWTSAVPASSS